MAGTSNGATNNLGPGGRSFRSDLLVAADSVTNAMSTLVRELNSGTDLDLFSFEYLSKRQTQLLGYDFWSNSSTVAYLLVMCSRELSRAFYSKIEIFLIRKRNEHRMLIQMLR